MARIAQITVSVLTSAALAFGLSTVAFNFFWPTADVPMRILAGLVLGLVHFALTWFVAGAPVGKRSLKLGSRKFSEFYSDWYNREGKVYVFCDDVEWLEPANARSIVEALKGKGARATVFLRDGSSSVVSELQTSGVVVVSIPATVNLRIKMSLRLENGKRELIIRDAKSATNSRKNIFRETSDQYMLDLAEDVLRAISPGSF